MRFIIVGVIAAVIALLLLGSRDDRQPCNATGDVRYIGDRKYVCEQTTGNGLRWTWQF